MIEREKRSFTEGLVIINKALYGDLRKFSEIHFTFSKTPGRQVKGSKI